MIDIENAIYPEIETIKNGIGLRSWTTLRIQRRPKWWMRKRWYTVKFFKETRYPTITTNAERAAYAISHNMALHREVYFILICGKISDAVDSFGDKMFPVDIDQTDESERIKHKYYIYGK